MLKSGCLGTYLISVMEEENSIFVKCLQSPMCVPIHSVCVVCAHICVPIGEHVYHSEKEGGNSMSCKAQ